MQAKIWNMNKWVDNIPADDEIKSFYSDALQKAGFNVLEVIDHRFQPYGYTALWLLGESHFAVHTFPEENRYYIELSSCNEKYFNRFIGMICR